MSPVAIGLFELIVLGILVGGIVLVGTLLANPKTRGVAFAFLGAGGLLVLLVASFLSVSYVSLQRHQSVETTVPMPQHFVAHSGEAEVSVSGEFEAFAPPVVVTQPSPAPVVHVGGKLATWVLIIPVIVLVMIGIVFVFARGNSSLGLGLLGLAGGAAVLVMCLAWFGLSAVHLPPSTPVAGHYPDDHRDAWEFVTAPRIVVEVEDQAATTSDSASADPDSGETLDKSDATASTPAIDDSNSNRPDWVDQRSGIVGNVVRRVLATDPYPTINECEAAMISKINDAARQRVSILVGNEPPSMLDMGVPPSYLTQNCIREQYLEERLTGSGFTVWTQYVLLEFSPTVDNHLIDRYQASQRSARVTNVALSGAGVMGLLGMVLGLLRLDSATKGYYTKRLFIGVPLAIIALLGLLVVVA